MVSSADYGDSQFNLAAQGRRQPGSTFKTFVLTAAIKQGIDPYSTYYASKPLDLDLPYWGRWEVATADEGYQGIVNLQQATVSSDNTVFAQLDLDVGPEKVADTAKSMGITTQLDGYPRRGDRWPADRRLAARDGERLRDPGHRRHPPPAGAIQPGRLPQRPRRRPAAPRPESGSSPTAVAYEVTRILNDNITGGTGTAAYTGCAGQAGKTGTTDNYTDAWFVGYQPNLATAVWVGYPESNDIEMTSVHGITVFGGTFLAQIWNSLYSEAGTASVPCEESVRHTDQLDRLLRAATPRPGAAPRTKRPGGAGGRRGGGGPGTDAVGGYDPDAYAPGAGQDPAPIPDPYGPPQSEVGGVGSAGSEG